jgi:hypothetical protein
MTTPQNERAETHPILSKSQQKIATISGSAEHQQQHSNTVKKWLENCSSKSLGELGVACP